MDDYSTCLPSSVDGLILPASGKLFYYLTTVGLPHTTWVLPATPPTPTPPPPRMPCPLPTFNTLLPIIGPLDPLEFCITTHSCYLPQKVGAINTSHSACTYSITTVSSVLWTVVPCIPCCYVWDFSVYLYTSYLSPSYTYTI